MPGVPGVRNAPPGDRDEDGGSGGYEEDGAAPVDATKFGGEIGWSEVKFEEDRDEYEGDKDDR